MFLPIALNVPGCLRRLGQVIGQCEALTPAPNVLEQNRTKSVAQLRFCGSRAHEGGEA